MLHQTFTARAFDAILSQIECRADLSCVTYAMVDGVQWEFEARFTVEWDGPFSDCPGDPDYWQADCALIGAWAFDPETGAGFFAGNRAETVALIGEEAVRRWECQASETAMESDE